MTLLVAKLTVTCPKTGKAVEVKDECVNCPNYEYTSYRGLTPYVSCSLQN